jgi:ubiquinone/menaquinone biosynthesis C-methylase UbiE
MTDPARFVAEAFLIILGREVGPVERRDVLRGFSGADAHGLIVRLLSSPEFQLRHDALRSEDADDVQYESALHTVGSAHEFVRRAYELLLGRAADPSGLDHYTAALQKGDSRASVLRSLIRSDEFARRFREVAPQAGVIPHDVQLCELANPAKWDNPAWTARLRELGLTDHKLSMHRKAYEFTQLVYGLERLGLLNDSVSVLSVGAGHEGVLFWLANHVGHVVATDLYEGVWQQVQSREGDAGVMHDPASYAPFPYREDRLEFRRMDATHLEFEDNRFDAAYSLSSIEHFGGVEGAGGAIDEMARVVKPGGIIALATEHAIAGPPHPEVFQPEQIAALVSRPGLQLLQPIDARVYERYDYAAVDLYKNPHQTPHMVVRFNDTVFTTVFVWLRKVAGG